jgi:hypothetical protein
MRKLSRCFILGAALVVCSCITVPVLPVGGSGPEVGKEATKLERGVSTRAEVRTSLGAPGFVGNDFDLWVLERDPPHVWWVTLPLLPLLPIFDVVRTGEAIQSSLIVAYDGMDRVDSWRWVNAAGISAASAPTEAVSVAVEPEQRLSWTADQSIRTSDGTIVAIKRPSPDILQVDYLDEQTGQRLEQFSGSLDGCIASVDTLFGPNVTFHIVDEALISIPARIAIGSLPCRWERSSAGVFDRSLLFEEVADAVPRRIKLADHLLFVDEHGAGVGIFDLTGERLAAVDPVRSINAASASGDGNRSVIRTVEKNGEFRYWLFERGTSSVMALPALDVSGWLHPCAGGPIALSPAGTLLAVKCVAHVQVWSLPDGAPAADLLVALPAPVRFASSQVAFSADGKRLVICCHGVMLWETSNWSLEAFLPEDTTEISTTATSFSLTDDGTEMVAGNSLFRLVP